jgi:hypothetical protein
MKVPSGSWHVARRGSSPLGCQSSLVEARCMSGPEAWSADKHDHPGWAIAPLVARSSKFKIGQLADHGR